MTVAGIGGSFPDVLRGFASDGDSGRSGCLYIMSDDERHAGRVYLRDGRVYAITVDGFRARFAQRMRVGGFIDDEQYESLVAECGSPYAPEAGTVAVSKGYVGQDCVQVMYREQLLSAAVAMSTWGRVQTLFDPEESTDAFTVAPLAVESLLRAVGKRHDKWHELWARVCPLSEIDHAYPRALVDAEEAIRLGLPTEVVAMVRIADGDVVFDDLAGRLGLTRFEAVVLLGMLLDNHAVTFEPRGGADVAAPRGSGPDQHDDIDTHRLGPDPTGTTTSDVGAPVATTDGAQDAEAGTTTSPEEGARVSTQPGAHAARARRAKIFGKTRREDEAPGGHEPTGTGAGAGTAGGTVFTPGAGGTTNAAVLPPPGAPVTGSTDWVSGQRDAQLASPPSKDTAMHSTSRPGPGSSALDTAAHASSSPARDRPTPPVDVDESAGPDESAGDLGVENGVDNGHVRPVVPLGRAGLPPRPPLSGGAPPPKPPLLDSSAVAPAQPPPLPVVPSEPEQPPGPMLALDDALGPAVDTAPLVDPPVAGPDALPVPVPVPVATAADDSGHDGVLTTPGMEPDGARQAVGRHLLPDEGPTDVDAGPFALQTAEAWQPHAGHDDQASRKPAPAGETPSRAAAERLLHDAESALADACQEQEAAIWARETLHGLIAEAVVQQREARAVKSGLQSTLVETRSAAQQARQACADADEEQQAAGEALRRAQVLYEEAATRARLLRDAVEETEGRVATAVRELAAAHERLSTATEEVGEAQDTQREVEERVLRAERSVDEAQDRLFEARSALDAAHTHR